MEYVFQAIGIGFLLSIMIGPVFFVLLEISITKGFKSALIFDLGVLLSDLFYIVISLFFAYQLKGLGDVKNNLALSILGGSLFIAFGVYNLFFKKLGNFDLCKIWRKLKQVQNIMGEGHFVGLLLKK